MDAFELADLAARREASGAPYLEFLTVPDLSVGLYVLAAASRTSSNRTPRTRCTT